MFIFIVDECVVLMATAHLYGIILLKK